MILTDATEPVRNSMVTKHFYIESQRIATKLTESNEGLLQGNAGNNKIDYSNKQAKLQGYFNKQYADLDIDLEKVEGTAGNSGNTPPGQSNTPPNGNGSGNNNGGNGNGGNGNGGNGNGNNTEAFVFYYHSDHLGSSSYISDANGEVCQHLEYFAFGEAFLEEHSNTERTPYLFNGKELDEETGLYYYGARYFDPKTSVWQSVDPLGTYDPIMNEEHYIDGEHNGGVFYSGNLNTYGYCYQSPVKYVDPNGKQNVAGAIGGVVIGGIIGGGFEAVSQYMKYGEVRDWKAVGGAATQGAITGGVAGFTSGASLLVTAGASGTANVIGGAANRKIQGKETTASDVMLDFTVGAVVGVAASKLNGYINKFANSSAGQSIGKQVSGLAKSLNIYSGQKSLAKNGGDIIAKYLKQMEEGTFNKGGAGFITKEGKIILTEGNHSMNAALQHSLKTGDSKYIKMIIEKGNFTKNVSPKDYGIPTYFLPTK